MNLSASESDTIPSTGGQDSVLIAYDDLRKVNSKLVELEYEKNINKHLSSIIYNDSIAIHGLRNRIQTMETDCERRVKNVKRERNIVSGIGIGAIILLILRLL